MATLIANLSRERLEHIKNVRMLEVAQNSKATGGPTLPFVFIPDDADGSPPALTISQPVRLRARLVPAQAEHATKPHHRGEAQAEHSADFAPDPAK